MQLMECRPSSTVAISVSTRKSSTALAGDEADASHGATLSPNDRVFAQIAFYVPIHGRKWRIYDILVPAGLGYGR